MPDYVFQNPGLNCGRLDLTKINVEKISGNNTTWVACEVDPKLYLHIPYGEFVPKPHAVISFSDPCFATVCTDQLNSIQGMQWFFRNVLIQNANGNQNAAPNNVQPNPVSSLNAIDQAKDAALASAGKAVDTASINNMEFQPAAVYPAAAAIPMISNIDSYGPWVSSNFGSLVTNQGSYGGLNVEVNADLVPWNYGNSLILNAVGNTLVENNSIGLTRQETGSFSVPGLPQQTTNIGQVIGTYGPLLTGINFTYGSSVSTSYEFKTYTPKFGKLAKLYIDKFKKIGAKRREMVRFLKVQAVNQYRAKQKFSAISAMQAMNKQAASKQASLQRTIIGEIYNLYDLGGGKTAQKTVVGTTTLDKTSVEMMSEYNKKAYMSMDGLFGPVSVNGDGGLPRFAIPKPEFDDAKNKPLSKNPHPPFFNDNEDVANLNISKNYLNPLNNKVNAGNHHHTGNGCGHNIDLVGREEEIPEDGMLRSFYSINDDDRFSNDYRFVAMRGPLVLHAWGYDTEGKPIPNEADLDDNAKGGDFTKTDLKDKFLSNWLGKPATWPVAPVDLRFDRARGVWVSPQPPRLIRAILDTKLDKNNSCEASVLFNPINNDVYDAEGNIVDDPEKAKITVYERLGSCYPSGTLIYAYYHTQFNQYWVVEGTIGCDHCPPSTGLIEGKEEYAFTIGRLDLKEIPGWDKTKEQVLGHDTEGCLKWIDTAVCPTGTTT